MSWPQRFQDSLENGELMVNSYHHQAEVDTKQLAAKKSWKATGKKGKIGEHQKSPDVFCVFF